MLAGCGQKDVLGFDENSAVVIEKRANNELSDDYEVIKEIEDKETVQKVIGILKGVKWQTNMDVDMEHEPDYKLNGHYHMWITPLGDRLEIIRVDDGGFGQLSKSDSAELFRLMTGEELEAS